MQEFKKEIAALKSSHEYSLRSVRESSVASPHVPLQWGLRCCANGGLNSHTLPPSRIRPGKTAFGAQGLPFVQAFCFFNNSENQTTAQFRTSAGGAGRSNAALFLISASSELQRGKGYEGVNDNTGVRPVFCVSYSGRRSYRKGAGDGILAWRRRLGESRSDRYGVTRGPLCSRSKEGPIRKQSYV